MSKFIAWFDQSPVVADFINATILGVAFVCGILFGRMHL